MRIEDKWKKFYHKPPSIGCDLYTRVDLLHIRHSIEAVPVRARLRNVVRYLKALDVVLSDHEVGEQARAIVPCEMAVERPDTWVVGEELEDCVCRGDTSVRHQGTIEDVHVTAHGVTRVSDLAIPCTVAFS